MSNVKRCPRPPHLKSSSKGTLTERAPRWLVSCADKIWRQWNAGIFICSSNVPRSLRASGVAGGARGAGGGGGGGELQGCLLPSVAASAAAASGSNRRGASWAGHHTTCSAGMAARGAGKTGTR